MTGLELVRGAYEWATANALWILIGAVALPVVGTIAAALGKLGKTQEDGKQIASVVLTVAVICVVLEGMLLTVARGALGLPLLGMDVRLLAAPLVCLAGSVLGIRLVFPLSAIGSVKTMTDLLLFIGSIAAIAWLFSRFRWGVYFIGSIGQLLAITAVAIWFLRRLYRRTFG